ncbi:hypothetical protein Tco_0815499 [Tanacetum coccineum]
MNQMSKRNDTGSPSRRSSMKILAERIHGLDLQMERKGDESLYFMDRIWVLLLGSVMDEAHASRYLTDQVSSFSSYTRRFQDVKLARIYIDEWNSGVRSTQMSWNDLPRGFGGGVDRVVIKRYCRHGRALVCILKERKGKVEVTEVLNECMLLSCVNLKEVLADANLQVTIGCDQVITYCAAVHKKVFWFVFSGDAVGYGCDLIEYFRIYW